MFQAPGVFPGLESKIEASLGICRFQTADSLTSYSGDHRRCSGRYVEKARGAAQIQADIMTGKVMSSDGVCLAE